MGEIEALLGLPVAALHLAVVAGRIGTMSLWRIPSLVAAASNRVGSFRLLLEKRLVNSKPLSVWTRSTRMPLRAYHWNNLFRKSAEE